MLKFLGCLTIPVAIPIGLFMWIGSQTFNRPLEKALAGIYTLGWVPAMLVLGVACFFYPTARLPTLAAFVGGIAVLILAYHMSKN